MARHTGLGRGLDALIPDRTKKKNDEASHTASDELKQEAKHGKSDASEKEADHSSPDVKADAVSAEEKTKASSEVKPKSSPSEAKEKPGKNPEDEKSASSAETMVRISLVEPNRSQPRKVFQEEPLKELSDSIRKFGIIQPLLVQKKDGYFEIIAGERRWRAAKMAGLKEVPVIIKDFTNKEAVEVSLIENIQREDLNPIEEAKAYKRLIDEFSLNQENVADRVSKSRTAVTNSMRLLKLDERVQNLVVDGSISEGHARALLGIPDPEVQNTFAQRIVKEHLNVRQVEKMVHDLTAPAHRPVKKKDAQMEVIYKSITEQLKGILGTKVEINQIGKNKGRIEIEYYSEEELERIYDLLKSIEGVQA
ncbi:MAG: ParB/RepB/Spo0J family partition protein [Lachnospiraceae bacterium]|jgi:ParB family chromosome partitioning protein|nr:ParB/RepB/Spo0J family partition protein [Lachnospiraceae bacterium]